MNTIAIDGFLYNDYLLITNSFDQKESKFVYAKWVNDQNIRIRLMFVENYDDAGLVMTNALYPVSLEFTKKKSINTSLLFGLGYDYKSYWTNGWGFVEIPYDMNIISINLTDYKKIHKTPWYIGNKTTLPKQLVFVEVGGKYRIGCIDINYIPNIKIKPQLFDSWWNKTHDNTNIIDEKKCIVYDFIDYFKQNSRPALNIILSYIVTEDILLTGAGGEMVKPFMDKNHFKINEKHCHHAMFGGNELSSVITNCITSWIRENCSYHILTLIPILISYGYVDECSKAIGSAIIESKENYTAQIFVLFGTHMNFTKTNIIDEIHLFGQHCNINPINECIKAKHLQGVISLVDFYGLYSIRCFDALIKQNWDMLVDWVINSGKYDEVIPKSTNKTYYMIHKFSTLSSYVKKSKTNFSDLESSGFHLLEHIIEISESSKQTYELLSIIGVSENDAKQYIDRVISSVLFNCADKNLMNRFDFMMNEYKVSKDILLCSTRKGIPTGILISLSHHLPTTKEPILHIVKKYNMNNYTNVIKKLLPKQDYFTKKCITSLNTLLNEL